MRTTIIYSEAEECTEVEQFSRYTLPAWSLAAGANCLPFLCAAAAAPWDRHPNQDAHGLAGSMGDFLCREPRYQ